MCIPQYFSSLSKTLGLQRHIMNLFKWCNDKNDHRRILMLQYCWFVCMIQVDSVVNVVASLLLWGKTMFYKSLSGCRVYEAKQTERHDVGLSSLMLWCVLAAGRASQKGGPSAWDSQSGHTGDQRGGCSGRLISLCCRTEKFRRSSNPRPSGSVTPQPMADRITMTPPLKHHRDCVILFSNFCGFCAILTPFFLFIYLLIY